MQSPASPNRKLQLSRCVALGVAVAVSVVLGAGPSRAQAVGPPSSAGEEVVSAKLPQSTAPPAGSFAERFPNLVLKTHEGKNVRFYDDLLKDKIVLVNFMYASCKDR